MTSFASSQKTCATILIRNLDPHNALFQDYALRNNYFALTLRLVGIIFPKIHPQYVFIQDYDLRNNYFALILYLLALYFPVI